MELCPTAAITMSRITIQELNRRLLDASLKIPRMVLTCEYTKALAHLEESAPQGKTKNKKKGKSKSDAQGKNENGTKDKSVSDILYKAQSEELLHYVPCFGMMGPEIWFSLLNELDQLNLKRIDILLPSGQCGRCPINVTDKAEYCFEEALSTAERWTMRPVGLLFDSAELSKDPLSILAPFREITSQENAFARREALGGTLKSLLDAWNSAAEAAEAATVQKLTPIQEAAIKRNRREAYQKTVLGQQKSFRADNPLQTPPQSQAVSPSQGSSSLQTLSRSPGSSQSQVALAASRSSIVRSQKTAEVPRVVPKRYMLIEALGRNPTNAALVQLTISRTKKKHCTACGLCITSCPLHARSFNEKQKVKVDNAICLGCGHCKTACPEKAIAMTTITGDEYLVS